MDDARKAVWVSVFADFVMVWPQIEPNAARIKVWDKALSDLSAGQIRRAADHVIQNHSSGFPPTPGEMRDAIFGVLTWKMVRHPVDGKIIGREQVREFPAPPMELPPRREPEQFVLPAHVARELEARWKPR